ncbi:hypothetical protein ACOSQ2_004312 [Xanthoceras sorbifolium]
MITTSEVCTLCEEGFDSSDHAIWGCPCLKADWTCYPLLPVFLKAYFVEFFDRLGFTFSVQGLQVVTQFMVAAWLAWRKRNLLFHGCDSGGLSNFWVSAGEFLELLGGSVVSGNSSLVASSSGVFAAGGSGGSGAAVSRVPDVGVFPGGQSAGGLELVDGYNLGCLCDIKGMLGSNGNFLVGSIVNHGGLRVGERRRVCPTISSGLGASQNCIAV